MKIENLYKDNNIIIKSSSHKNAKRNERNEYERNE